MGFQKGLGCVHSLSHSLGGVNPKLHHGTLNAMFLPAVVRFNAHAESVQRDRRMQRMAYAMGLGEVGGVDASAKSSMVAAEAVAESITAMNAKLGLPKGLADMGVERAWFGKIIEGAMADHCHKTNPRIATAQEYRAMLESAM